MPKLFTRRAFLITGAAVAGVAATGVAVGLGYLASIDIEGLEPRVGPDGRLDLNAFITIDASGQVTLNVAHLEMGQGIQTGLATLVAEELEVDPAAIKVVHPVEPLPAYGNYTLILNTRPEETSGPMQWVARRFFATLPYIGTGGSTSIKNTWVHYRLAGATARELLIDAASRRLGVARESLRAEAGRVLGPSGQSIFYGDLAADAVREKPRQGIVLKTRDQFSRIGTDVPRVDLRAKVTGEARYGIDAAPPGLLYAAAALPPPGGGKVTAFDEKAARAVEGVIDVQSIQDGDRSLGVAVVANSYWTAKQAIAAANPQFSADFAGTTNAQVMQSLAQDLKGSLTERFVTGNASSAGERVAAAYETAALAHACMEPMCATVLYAGNGVFEAWGSAQSPVMMQIGIEKAVAITGTPFASSTNHVLFAGGGFGRKSEGDAYRLAAILAIRHEGRPVKLIYSREDDIGHGTFLPFTRNEMLAVVGEDGRPLSLQAKVAGASVQNEFSTRWLPFTDAPESDGPQLEAHDHLAYAVPHHSLHAIAKPQPLPAGFWRANGNYYNGFAIESFIDELAHRAKADPLAYRRSMAIADPRLTRVYDALTRLSGWGTQLPQGKGRGIAAFESYGSMTGIVAEVTVTDRTVTVDHVYCAVDAGIVVNPLIVKQQVESSVIWSLSAALNERLTLQDGAVVETNFDQYQVLSLANCPAITVEVISSDGPPGGVGETAVGPLAPALGNAIYAASGLRVRQLPMLDLQGKLLAA